MRWRRIVFQHKCYPKLKAIIAWIMHAGYRRQVYFPCDSHPHLCRNCQMLRAWLQIGSVPPILYIKTRKGIYKCVTRHRLRHRA